jgi:hypothetical protein
VFSVCVWRTDTGETTRHTHRCQSIIDTGHSWNIYIFSVKALPLSSNMSACFFFTNALRSLTFLTSATAAGDGQVRAFDLLRSARTVTRGRPGSKVSPLLLSRCHSSYAKRRSRGWPKPICWPRRGAIYITSSAPDMTDSNGTPA